MNSQAEFMETLHEVAEIVKTSIEPMSREQIVSYFEDMNLSEEQQEQVYQYLMTPQEEEEEAEEGTEPEKNEADETQDENSEEKESEDEQSESGFFQMYLDDLGEITPLDETEENLLYEKLVAGDESAIKPLAENWLIRVLEMAQEQVTMDEYLEDVIQEGNMSVFLTLSGLCGSGRKENWEEMISDAAMVAMNSYLVEELSDELAMNSRKQEEHK